MSVLPPRRGASAVEFALCMPFALLAIVSMTDFAMWTLTHHAVSRAVQDAANIASRTVIPDGGDDGAIIETTASDMATESLTLWGATPAGTTVTADWKADADDMMWLTVYARVPYEPLMGTFSPFKRDVERQFVVLTMEQIN